MTFCLIKKFQDFPTTFKKNMLQTSTALPKMYFPKNVCSKAQVLK